MKKIIVSALLAALMIITLAVPAFAYQSAFKTGDFTEAGKAKVAAFKDGDNIFKLGEYDTSTYDTAMKFCESGNAAYVPQRNKNKWGYAYGSPAINGMANVGDGITTSTTSNKPAGALWFSKSTTDTKLVNADAEEGEGAKYLTLCGWEFADTFKAKGFKIYFNKDAYADDFDLLIGHVDGDAIVWEVAYEGTDMASKFTSADENTYVFTADFSKTMTGKFIQIGPKTTEGMNTTAKSGHSGYVCNELEVYYGEVKTPASTTETPASTTETPASTTKAPETTKAVSPSTGDSTVNYYIVVAVVIALAASAIVIGKRRAND